MSFSLTSLLFALDTCQALRDEEQKGKETDKFPHFFSSLTVSHSGWNL